MAYTGEESISIRQMNLYGALIKKYIDNQGNLSEYAIQESDWLEIHENDENYFGTTTYKCEILTNKLNQQVKKIINTDNEEMMCIAVILGKYVTLYSDEKFSGTLYTV